MSNCASSLPLRRAYAGTLGTLAVAALIFYVAQNTHRLVGGVIAPAKLLWLGYALLFWYFIPGLVLGDDRTPRGVRYAYTLFLVNMLLRAVVELWMLYLGHNWHPYYGIAHDLLSVAILFGLYGWLPVTDSLTGLLRANLLVLAAMFVVETGFAGYMARHFVTHGAQPIYFVPDSGGHALVIRITWGVVLVLTGYLWIFSRRWLYANPQR